MDLAVAFFTFNRLDTASRVFETIREAKPNRLYLISDGPRYGIINEASRIQDVRTYVEKNIDWDCKVKKNYADYNMGCMERISSGISWVFQFEEAAVILEDDILPNSDFYEFMHDMLELYKDNEQIMLVSGFKIISQFPLSDSYTFSNFPMIWGWGTWKRAWKHFDKDIKSWPQNKRRGSIKKYFNCWGYLVEKMHLDEVYNHKTKNIWDYQWTYAVLERNGLAIIPKYNLINNLGIGHADATNTSTMTSQDFTTYSIDKPYKHPTIICANREYDAAHMKNGWGTKAIIKKILQRLIKLGI